MSKILLSGVPGTGKSTVAKYIETNYNFFHIDMEQDDFAPRYKFEKDPPSFLNRLATHKNALISWGFGPFQDRASVRYLQDHDFTFIWLDGDRIASFREFMKRENKNPVKEAMYYGQMQMVVVTGIIEALKPIVINPFTETGQFRPVDDIAQEILKSVD